MNNFIIDINNMDYIKSPYTSFIKNDQGDLIVCNTLHGTICKYKQPFSDTIINIFKGEKKEKENTLIKHELFSKHFIIESHLNEKALSYFRYQNYIMNNILEFTIIPTYSCNFRCPYCYQSHDNIYMSDELVESFIRYIRKNINQYKSVHLSWFGGEPLEALNIVKYVSNKVKEICTKRFKSFTSSMTTNGYGLDFNTFNLLYDLGVRTYQITIDGPREIHNKQRFTVDGKDTFDTIVDNLVRIKNKSKHKLYKFLIRTNISQEGLASLDNYLDYMHQKIGYDEKFIFYFRPIGDWGGNSIIELKDSLLIDSDIEIYKKLLYANKHLNFSSYLSELTRISVCYAAKRYSYVLDPSGSIGKCTCDSIENFNKIGSLDLNGNINIDFYKEALWINDYRDEKCTSCFLEANCHNSICPARHLVESKKCDSCPNIKHNFANILRMISLNDDYVPTVEL